MNGEERVVRHSYELKKCLSNGLNSYKIICDVIDNDNH